MHPSDPPQLDEIRRRRREAFSAVAALGAGGAAWLAFGGAPALASGGAAAQRDCVALTTEVTETQRGGDAGAITMGVRR